MEPPLLTDDELWTLYALSGGSGFSQGWTAADLVNERGGTEGEQAALLDDLLARGLIVRDDKGFGASAAGEAAFKAGFKVLVAASWCTDGAQSLSDAAAHLWARAAELERLAAEGWRMVNEVDEGDIWLTRTRESAPAGVAAEPGPRMRLSPLAGQ